MDSNSKTILFVDDSPDFLELLLSLAQQSKRGRWNVLTASTTVQALRYLRSQNVDLAVLDIRMPIVDGIQFLQLIHRKHPQMKKALLSSYPDDARRHNAKQHGAELVLTKPLDLPSFELLFETLDELLNTQVEEGFRGVLRKIGLEDILQMECLSRHTSLLEVTTGHEHGRIYIRNGKIVHAEFAGAVGEEALNQLLALKGGEFHHAPYQEPEKPTIDGSWEFLLMEAARRRDELSAGGDLEEAAIAGELPSRKQSDTAFEEMVITTQRGQVLFERGAADVDARASVLRLLNNVGGKLDALLMFGALERVEFPAGGELSIARLTEHGSVFVRGSRTN